MQSFPPCYDATAHGNGENGGKNGTRDIGHGHRRGGMAAASALGCATRPLHEESFRTIGRDGDGERAGRVSKEHEGTQRSENPDIRCVSQESDSPDILCIQQ